MTGKPVITGGSTTKVKYIEQRRSTTATQTQTNCFTMNSTDNSKLDRFYKFFERYDLVRMDGLGEDYFAGMSESEKVAAWQFLVKGFSTSVERINGLYQLDSGRAVKLFQEELKMPPPTAAYADQQKEYESARILMLKLASHGEHSDLGGNDVRVCRQRVSSSLRGNRDIWRGSGMTAAFEKFMRQHQMTGSEKADGYSRDVFVGLESEERTKVFNLLIDELPWSAEWIFLVNSDKAEQVAVELERQWRKNPDKHVDWLQKQLVLRTGDLKYQQHMIEDYFNYSEWLRPGVVESVGATPTNKAKLEFLKQVILVEFDEDAVVAAIRHLLYSVKFQCTTDEEKRKYEGLVKFLRDEDLDVKQSALLELQPYIDAATVDG